MQEDFDIVIKWTAGLCNGMYKIGNLKMICTNIISFIFLQMLTAVFVGLAVLIISIVGIRKTPYVKGKIGILGSLLFFAACCTAAIIFAVNSNKAELEEALFHAARTANATKAKELVAKGADIDEADYDGWTLLRISIEWGDFRMFKTLVEAGANVNNSWTSRDGEQTPIQFVLEKSYYHGRNEFDYPAVKLLIEHGAAFDFNAVDGQCRTCLQNTIEKNQSEILKLMLGNGADISLHNKAGGVLHWAIRDNTSITTLELLLAHHPDVNAKDELGYTPLHKAVFHRRKDIVSILIENGADVSAKNNHNMTALELAKSLKKSGSGIQQEIIDMLEQRK